MRRPGAGLGQGRRCVVGFADVLRDHDRNSFD